MENKKCLLGKFNVRAVSEEFKQYDDSLKLFAGIQDEYHAKLDDDQQKADDFWFDKADQKIFTFNHFVHNYLQENEEVMSRRSESSRKLNHQAQILVLSLESLENQLKRKLLMKK